MSEATLERPNAKQQDKPIMRFRLLHGCHVDTDPATVGKVDALGRPLPPKDRMYVQGDIIESTVDLAVEIDHNCKDFPQKKFQRVYGDPIGDVQRQLESAAADPAPAAPPATQWTIDNLSKRSVQELKQLVAKQKIPNPNRLETKEDLIRLILGGAK